MTASVITTLSSLIFLQLSSRLLTFALNQSLVRLSSPQVYGTASIQFELLSSTILFLGREGVRNALLRTTITNTKDDDRQRQKLTWLPLVLGIPIAIISLSMYLWFASEEVVSQSMFYPSLAVYTLAALIELASEPGHNHVMMTDQTRIRVHAEGTGITLKTLVTFAILVSSSFRRPGDQEQPKNHAIGQDWGLLSYAIGQLVYSLTLVAIYVGQLGLGPWRPSFPFVFFRSFRGEQNPLLRLSLTMTSQSIIKHFLTEGDRVLLSLFAKLEDQGGYALAVNYGSLIARIAFQPIEETLRLYFSKVLPQPRTSTSLTPKTASTATNQEESKEEEEAFKVASTTLTDVLRLQTTFSIFFVIFGSAYLGSLLNILLPERYLQTSAPQILQAYVYYIPFLSINGSLEAFLSSAATPTDLSTQSSYMILFSLAYVSSAVAFYSLAHLGDSSLIFANMVNLSTRISYALSFCRRYFTAPHTFTPTSASTGTRTTTITPAPPHPPSFSPFVAFLPHWIVIIGSLACMLALNFVLPGTFLSTSSSSRSIHFRELVRNLLLGGLLALSWLSVWWFTSGKSLVSRMVGIKRKVKRE